MNNKLHILNIDLNTILDNGPEMFRIALEETDITLTPLAMVMPTHASIYAPSRIKSPETIKLADWAYKMSSRIIQVSLAEDGFSNPIPQQVYTGMGGYWIIQ